MVTSHGTMVIALDPLAAPKAVNSFVFLARYHYYDGIVFHRIIPGFVLQGGDPTGNGLGRSRLPLRRRAPGRRALPGRAPWPWPTPGPNTNGSQFFVISGPDGVRLPPLYSLFGEVVSGLTWSRPSTPSAAARARRPSVCVIESVTIEEKD